MHFLAIPLTAAILSWSSVWFVWLVTQREVNEMGASVCPNSTISVCFMQ